MARFANSKLLHDTDTFSVLFDLKTNRPPPYFPRNTQELNKTTDTYTHTRFQGKEMAHSQKDARLDIVITALIGLPTGQRIDKILTLRKLIGLTPAPVFVH